MDYVFISNVKSILEKFIEKNELKFLSLEKQQDLGVALKLHEYEQRGFTVLFLQNERFILEIFSDPQGGEVNCRIAKFENTIGNNISWKYFYELFPLTSAELSKIRNSQRSMETQFSVLTQKLIEADLTLM